MTKKKEKEKRNKIQFSLTLFWKNEGLSTFHDQFTGVVNHVNDLNLTVYSVNACQQRNALIFPNSRLYGNDVNRSNLSRLFLV